MSKMIITAPSQTKEKIGMHYICDQLVKVMQSNNKLNYLLMRAMQSLNNNLESVGNIIKDDAEKALALTKQQALVNYALIASVVILPFAPVLVSGASGEGMWSVVGDAAQTMPATAQSFSGAYQGVLTVQKGALDKKLTIAEIISGILDRATKTLTKGSIATNMKTLQQLARAIKAQCIAMARSIRVLKT